jgi:TetR/AcrR family transcriptional regulator, cholesterol catabolism regulator
LNRTPRQDDRRDRLIEAAARLFRKQGYERTSVRQLAEAVGILSGSVFHHFDSKEDILLAVMSTTITTMTERLSEAASSTSTTRDRLLALIRTELDLLHGKTRDAVSIIFFQWNSLSSENQKKLLAMREEYERIWLDALQAARDDGGLNAEPFIVRRLLTGANGWTIYWFHLDGALSLDELAGTILGLLTGSVSRG